MQACSRNANDTETFKKTVKSHLRSLKTAYKNTYLIGDSALYTEEIIRALASEKQYFITRVPQKLKEAKTILASTAEVNWINLSDDYAGAWFESCFGCETDAQAALKQWLGSTPLISLGEIQIIQNKKRNQCGRPSASHVTCNFYWMNINHKKLLSAIFVF